MRIVLLAAALAAALASPAVAQRAPDPVPIEEWSLEKVSAMGQAIYRQDVAAWVSTDALMAHLAGAPPPTGMAGWIVVDEGDAQRVRYVRDDGGVLKSAFDVMVRDGRAGAVEPTDAPLPADQTAHFRARQTAIDNIGRLRCSAQLNTVVLDDPDSDGWLVWLLTSTTEQNVVPFGGHYRFRISADGSTVLRRDMLSNSCISMSTAPPQGEGNRTAALSVSQIVSTGPVETHVFLSMLHRLPVYVIIPQDRRMFEVNGPSIRPVVVP